MEEGCEVWGMSKRLSEQKRESILQKLEDSELTAAEFCRRRGLCYGTVMGWRRRAKRMGIRSSERMPFVEVDLVEGNSPQVVSMERGESGVPSLASSSSAMASRLCAELSLPGGAVLRVYGIEKKNGTTEV